MKTIKFRLTVATVLMTFLSLTAQEFKKEHQLQEDANELKQKMLTKDPSISEFFANSKGYVIFPKVGKGGFVVGAAYGKGVVYENNQHIGFASLKQLDIGLQIGGKTYGEIVFFETKRALNEFKNNNFELSAQISAVAIDEGVAKNKKFDDNIAVFILPQKGLMADISIGGQRFVFENKTDARVSDF